MVIGKKAELSIFYKGLGGKDDKEGVSWNKNEI